MRGASIIGFNIGGWLFGWCLWDLISGNTNQFTSEVGFFAGFSFMALSGYQLARSSRRGGSRG